MTHSCHVCLFFFLRRNPNLAVPCLCHSFELILGVTSCSSWNDGNGNPTSHDDVIRGRRSSLPTKLHCSAATNRPGMCAARITNQFSPGMAHRSLTHLAFSIGLECSNSAVGCTAPNRHVNVCGSTGHGLDWRIIAVQAHFFAVAG